MKKLKKFISSKRVSNRIRNEINSHEESGYLIVVVDKNDKGNYLLKNTFFNRLDRRKVKWMGQILDQRMVFLFTVHDLSTDMVHKGYFNTPENLYSMQHPDEYDNIGYYSIN